MKKAGLRFAQLSAAVVAVLYGSHLTEARSLTWDGGGGVMPDGNGAWDASSLAWFDPGTSSVVVWSNTNPDSAFFGNGPVVPVTVGPNHNIFLSSDITVQDIQLNTASDGGYYSIVDEGDGLENLTLQGNIIKASGIGISQFQLTNPLTLSSGNHTVAINDTPGDLPEITMNNPLTGPGALTLDNGFNSSGYAQWGTLVMNLDSDYSGGTNIVKGRLVINTNSGLGSGPVVISNQGDLSIGGAGTSPLGNLNITNPVTITRNTYSGTDFNDYPDAITANNNGQPLSIETFSGPFTVDSTDARISANTSTILISSNIQQGPDVTNGVLTVDGDFAGFVTLTGDNSALAGGIQLIGGVELNVSSQLNLAGASSPLTFNGSATLHPIGGFMTDFGTHVVNYGTFNGGIDVDQNQSFSINQNLGGAGNTGGTIGKRGLGTLNIGGTNILGGTTFWDSGTVNVTGNTTLGSLHLRSPVVNITGVITTTSGYSSFGQDSTGTNGGPDQAQVNISGNGQLLLAAQDFNVSDNNNTTGTLTLSNNAIVTAGANSFFGKNPGTTGILTLNDSSSYTATGSFNIGGGTSGTGFVTMNNTSALTAKAQFFVGGGTNGIGTLTINGGTLNAQKTGQQSFAIGGGSNGKGTVNMNGGALNVSGEFWDGNNAGSTGIFTQTNGTVMLNDWFVVGRSGATGTLDISGGSITRGGTATGDNSYVGESANTASVMTVHGTGSVTINTGQFWLGNAGSSKGTLNVSDSGSFTVTNNWLAVGRNGTAQGVINLSGGSLTKTGTYNLATNTGTSFTIGSGGTATGIINQTGGTLSSDSTFIGENGTGTYNISAGTASLLNTLTIGTSAAGNGTFNISGTAAVTAGPITFGNANTSSGTLNLNGGSLTAASIGAGASTGTKTFNFNGGTLLPSGNSANFVSGLTTANVQAGGALINSNGFSAAISQPLVHAAALGATADGGLTKNGLGTLVLSGVNTYTGGTTVNSGVLEIAPTATPATNSSLPTNHALTINGATVKLDSNVTLGSQPTATPASSVNLSSLSITGNGTLDITNNHLMINYGSGPDPINSVASLIQNAYAGGNWTGFGITSTSAQANSLSYGIGYADSADAGNPAGLASNQIEIKYTLLGDANLDGKVNGTDFAILATNFNQAVNGWDAGDFNYDNKANGTDFAFIGSNFNQGASQADVTALDEFAAANGLLADVPEPASVGLIAIAGASLLQRRRRKM